MTDKKIFIQEHLDIMEVADCIHWIYREPEAIDVEYHVYRIEQVVKRLNEFIKKGYVEEVREYED